MKNHCGVGEASCWPTTEYTKPLYKGDDVTQAGPHTTVHARQRLEVPNGEPVEIYSLAALTERFPAVSSLPHCLRVVLESLLRNCDGHRVDATHIGQLAGWEPNAPRTAEIPFVVARVVLQDYTGVPLLTDLAAMRDAAQRWGRDPARVEPIVPVTLIVDHSVQIDHAASPDALRKNLELELSRNAERYAFLKWGGQAFKSIEVMPTGRGIVHQINLEYLAQGLRHAGSVVFPDTLVGADSHTTMINGIGVVGWGVGGIEAEAAMLGQPIYFLTPDVVGVELLGALPAGVTATDAALTITARLRDEKVVGTFVEFFGEGAAALAVPDRATIANMAPEYGATMGFFPVDDRTVDYLRQCGRTERQIELFTRYYREQQMFGMPQAGDCRYSRVVQIDLAALVPTVAGPKRPQDRIDLNRLGTSFEQAFTAPAQQGGYGRDAQDLGKRAVYDAQRADATIGHGDVLLAAITSCTNTSNPSVMLAAGLLARNAVQKGLRVDPRIKTTMAPGSRLVTDYLERAGLAPYLAQLGFSPDAYGCAACSGNVGPLSSPIESTVVAYDLVCAAVLSGNRNFEARIHPNLRANYLMSPPLVVAFALAGSVRIDTDRDPIGTTADGPVWLRDIWPSDAEVRELLHYAEDPQAARRIYADVLNGDEGWEAIPTPSWAAYTWPQSTYIAKPPFLDDAELEPSAPRPIRDARALAILGDSITTDHVSPVNAIRPDSPAGQWLQEHGVAVADFNILGARRGNYHVMARATFSNIRLRNRMCPPLPDGRPLEGGYAVHQPTGVQMTLYAAAQQYLAQGVACVVFAGEEYGTGSSRDWAAKGPALLGVRAVVARSFERIHRSNLIGMGILPLQFAAGESVDSLGIDGSERFDIEGVDCEFTPRQAVRLVIRRSDGTQQTAALTLRVDTPIESAYCRHGGILQYVLRSLVA